MSKPIPLDLTPHRHLVEDAREFLRMWARQDGPVTCFIDPARLGADPFLFGMAIADAVRHGARAWATAVNVPVDHAEERIWEGLDAERANPTDTPREIDPDAADPFITYPPPGRPH